MTVLPKLQMAYGPYAEKVVLSPPNERHKPVFGDTKNTFV